VSRGRRKGGKKELGGRAKVQMSGMVTVISLIRPYSSGALLHNLDAKPGEKETYCIVNKRGRKGADDSRIKSGQDSIVGEAGGIRGKG